MLELGCASGGNIIPMASRSPEARFVGIDASRRHVEDGCRRAAALGLSNLEFRHADLSTLSLRGETFDFIICHGVFSWVSDSVQRAILRLCAETLATNGLATVSYNVLPGWHLFSVIRDICLHHAGSEGSPIERVNRARHVLGHVAQMTSDTEPYGRLVRREAERLRRLPAGYVLGEFLAPHNRPCRFVEFAGRLQDWGLGYLCEGDLASSLSEQVFTGAYRRIRTISGDDRLAAEQYKDFVTGRPFRRSVLARSARIAEPAPAAERLLSLHVAARFRHDRDASDSPSDVFKDARGRSIKAAEPIVRQALSRLAEISPATSSVQELAELGLRIDNRRDTSRLCSALFTLAAAGQLAISTVPLRVGDSRSERPEVWPVARAEARTGQPWLTSLGHEAVPVPPLAAKLATVMDGNLDRRSLNARLMELRRAGAGDVAGTSEAKAGQNLQGILDTLASNALLL